MRILDYGDFGNYIPAGRPCRHRPSSGRALGPQFGRATRYAGNDYEPNSYGVFPDQHLKACGTFHLLFRIKDCGDNGGIDISLDIKVDGP